MTAVINKIVEVPGTMKPIDLRMLCNATGGYFVGTQKECNSFIKENDITVTSWEAIEMIYWKPRLVFYSIFITVFAIVICAIDYFFKIPLQFTSFIMGGVWCAISNFINEITKSK